MGGGRWEQTSLLPHVPARRDWSVYRGGVPVGFGSFRHSKEFVVHPVGVGILKSGISERAEFSVFGQGEAGEAKDLCIPMVE